MNLTKLLLPKKVSVLKFQTLLRAEKYECDLGKMAGEVFPNGLILPDSTERWQRIVEVTGPQGIKDPELWRHLQKFRHQTSMKRVVRNKVITTAYVTFLALMHQTDATTIGDFKYHDSGIGTGDEAVGDTGLGTPWSGARDVGTQVASTNTYTSVATTTYNTTKAITEHGLFNASTSVTLMDRTKFAAINVVDTNQIQWTFVITFTAGG
jgi:hypothetical protein